MCIHINANPHIFIRICTGAGVACEQGHCHQKQSMYTCYIKQSMYTCSIHICNLPTKNKVCIHTCIHTLFLVGRIHVYILCFWWVGTYVYRTCIHTLFYIKQSMYTCSIHLCTYPRGVLCMTVVRRASKATATKTKVYVHIYTQYIHIHIHTH